MPANTTTACKTMIQLVLAACHTHKKAYNLQQDDFWNVNVTIG
jgi:hypothetical protein